MLCGDIPAAFVWVTMKRLQGPSPGQNLATKWRSPFGGLDLVHKDLKSCDISSDRECKQLGLALNASKVCPSKRGVCTTTRRPDGHCLGSVPALYFSGPDFLKQFLTRDGTTSIYADRIILCKGVFQGGLETPVYAVPLGIVGAIMHFKFMGKDISVDAPNVRHANVRLDVNPMAGCRF